MVDNNYFDHNSPTYGSPQNMLRAHGITSTYTAENLARAASVERAHTILMNSDGHRANILNGNFKEVGIGIVDGPNGKIFAQEFLG